MITTYDETCPFCGAEVDYSGEIEIDEEGIAFQRFSCSDCGRDGVFDYADNSHQWEE